MKPDRNLRDHTLRLQGSPKSSFEKGIIVVAQLEERTSMVTDLPPLELVKAPKEGNFYSEDFLPGTDPSYTRLEMIGYTLVRECPEFAALRNITIRYVWKKKTPTSGGKDVWAKCQKLSGLLQFYTEADYVIIVSAEPARTMTNFQLEAMIHHELEHISVEETDEGETKLSVRGHDAEMFFANVNRYGLWQRDLLKAGLTFSQHPLPLPITGKESQ